MSDTLAILVPVLNRPQNIAPLIDSFLNNCPRTSTLNFLSDARTDQEEYETYCKECTYIRLGEDYERIIWQQTTNLITWPEKINEGIKRINADWYLCGADDIRPHKGWWEAANHLRENPQIGLIGTNDLGNPRVLAGEHTTHPLIRRTYYLQGGLDGESLIPQFVKHWYVDDILVATAKKRNAWAFCPDAIIEHLHPYWEKGEWDSTYSLGESSATEDRQAATVWAEKYLR